MKKNIDSSVRMRKYKKIFFSIVCLIIVLSFFTAIVSAEEANNTQQDTIHEKKIQQTDNKQNTNTHEIKSITKKEEQNTNNEEKTRKNSPSDTSSILLNVTVKNIPQDVGYDKNREYAITKNISTLNGKPDIKKLGFDYEYADEEGTYTITGEEIRRVMTWDSYCQQEFGFVPKYTFFRPVNSNTKYIISREKWNVIARSLIKYHVDYGFKIVDTPYAITVNLKNQRRYYPAYFDSEEVVNGHMFTCGTTTMSMISQALNCFRSEREMTNYYPATPSAGTSESSIIKKSPNIHMKLTNIANNKKSIITALSQGNIILWHIAGHYMCLIDYNNKADTFLLLNPSGPSHRLPAVGWVTWTKMRNTDRPLKDNGFMKVTSYWKLNSQQKQYTKNYYFNMGGKYTPPLNNQLANDNKDNKMTVIKKAPANIIKTTNTTSLMIKINVNNPQTKQSYIQVYLNNELIGTPIIKNQVAQLEYILPSKSQDNIEIMTKFSNYTNKVTFNKNSVGRSFTNITIMSMERIIMTKTGGKMGDKIYFVAYVRDRYDNKVNNGQVLFKINGKTVKKEGNVLKTMVKDGVAIASFIIPDYSAKNYTVTAVFINKTTRLENNNTLTISKVDSMITNMVLNLSDKKLLVNAKLVDVYGNDVKRESKISVKIDNKTVINKFRLNSSELNFVIDLSLYRMGKHYITIISGENGLYKKSTKNQEFVII